jgi:hypothetical protein
LTPLGGKKLSFFYEKLPRRLVLDISKKAQQQEAKI